jgi:chromate transporter
VSEPQRPVAGPGHGITLSRATKVWALVGLNSFGGPAGQIAVMHRLVVEQRRWSRSPPRRSSASSSSTSPSR